MKRRAEAALIVAVASVIVFVVAVVLLDRLVGLMVPAVPVRVAHPPNFHERRSNIEFSVDFRTNSMGLRYGEIPLKKQSQNEFRVFVAGDSMTEGWGVESDETFAAVLERSWSKPERKSYFINGGLSSAGPVEYGRILAVVGLRYEPDLVMIVVHPNDLSGNGTELDVVRSGSGRYHVRDPGVLWAPTGVMHTAAYYLLPWTYARLQSVRGSRDTANLEHGLGLIERVREKARRTGIPQAQVDTWQAKIPPEILKACDRGEFSQAWVAMGCLFPDNVIRELDVEGEVAEQKWTSMQHILTQIVELCRTETVKVAVVFTSDAFLYDETIGSVRKTVGVRFRPEWLTEESSEIERRLAQWATALDVPFLSLTQAFREACRESPGRYNHKLDEHWTVEGHQLAARVISQWLTEQGLLKRAAA